MVEIDGKGPQIKETDVALIEDEFGEKLPNDYRQFLLLYNGGNPIPDTVDVPEALWRSTDIQVFFGIGRSVASSDLLWNLRLIKDRFPNHRILPIACDSGGSLFCLRASKTGQFEVIYCDINGMLYEVAPHFSAFQNRIRT